MRFHEEDASWSCPAQLTVDGFYHLSFGDTIENQTVAGTLSFREKGPPAVYTSSQAAQTTGPFLERFSVQYPNQPAESEVFIDLFGMNDTITINVDTKDGTILGLGVAILQR